MQLETVYLGEEEESCAGKYSRMGGAPILQKDVLRHLET